jgi:hypothetical protein
MSDIEVRDKRRGGWFWIPNEVAEKHLMQLNHVALKVYLLLVRWANNNSQEAHPSLTTLASYTKNSRRKIIDALKVLEEAQLIQKTIRQKKPGDKITNSYAILDAPTGDVEVTSTGDVEVTSTGDVEVTSTGDVEVTTLIREKDLRKKDLLKKTSTPSAHASGGSQKPAKTFQPLPTDPTEIIPTNHNRKLTGAELEKFTAFTETIDCRAGGGSIADAWAQLERDCPDALRLALLLANSVKANFPTTNRPKFSAFGKWIQEIERLHKIDGHAWPLIEDVLTWSQQDDFWSRNVLSGPTLRRQWDKLAARHQSKPHQHHMTMEEIEAAIQADLNGGSHGNERGNFEDDGAIEAEFQPIFDGNGPQSYDGTDE